MANKIDLNELKNVSGGQTRRDPQINCPDCAKYNDAREAEVRREKVSCGQYKIYYKCQFCNFEWDSDYHKEH